MGEVNELETYGKIEDLGTYVAKADSLEKRVIEAITTIDEFNEEERAFKWEETFYPLRKQVLHFSLRTISLPWSTTTLGPITNV